MSLATRRVAVAALVAGGVVRTVRRSPRCFRGEDGWVRAHCRSAGSCPRGPSRGCGLHAEPCTRAASPRSGLPPGRRGSGGVTMPAKVRSISPWMRSGSLIVMSPWPTSSGKVMNRRPASRASTLNRCPPWGGPASMPVEVGALTLNLKWSPRSRSAAACSSSNRSRYGGGGTFRSRSRVARARPVGIHPVLGSSLSG